MGKQSGLGAAFYIDGYDLSGDIGSLSRINNAKNVLECTGIDKSAMERLHGLGDGGMEFTSYHNDTAGQAVPVLKTMPTTDRIATYLHRLTIGASAAACIAKQIDYAPNRGADGSLTYNTTVESNGFGMEWGNTLTAGKRTDTGATNGAAVDFEASTNFGLQAYLHVFSFTGTDATVKLQMDDNSNFTSATDVVGGGFTAVTSGPQAQRIQTARTYTVERYLRVVTTTSAGFSSLIFAVVVKKNNSLNLL